MRSLLFLCYVLLSSLNGQIIFAQILSNEKNDNYLDSIIVRVSYSVSQRNTEDATKFKVDTMFLDIGFKWSKYYDPTINKKDSIRNSIMQNLKSLSVIKDDPIAIKEGLDENKLNKTYIKSDEGVSYTIYKNRSENEIYTLDRNQSGVSVFFTEKLLFQNWVFDLDTTQILGFSCKKAYILFRGREYEVFFTPEIPLNDGPFKFYNLPGLIMKVKSSDSLFRFEAIGIQKINNETINIEINKQLEVSENIRQYQEFLKSKSNDAYVGFINNGNAVLYKSDLNKGFENIEKREE